MQVTTRGIVIHHIKYSEKSVIAKVYTEKFGLQSYLVHGVRNARSKNKAAYLQPLSLIEVNAIHKEKKGLQSVKSISLTSSYASIPFHIVKSSIAFFLAEILHKTIKEEEPNEALFEFLFHGFQLLDLSGEECVNFHLVFMGKLCKYLGIEPGKPSQSPGEFYFDLRESCFLVFPPAHNDYLPADLSAFFIAIMSTSLNDLNLSLSNSVRKQLLKAFIDYYHLHLSNFGNLKSLPVLEEVLH
ncbi:MAG: DNA repair protein RecO [Flavobacteriales bacterium]|nr:DNA repair protein RecO [Flavobacteriales bacterium]